MRDDPYRNYQFNLLIEGIQTAGFIEASGLGADIDVIEYRAAGNAGMVNHLPGQVHYRPITLKYGMGGDRSLWDWFDQTASGDLVRRNVSVIQYKPDGVTEAYRWNLDRAWPAQLGVASMDTHASSIAIESLTLIYDRLERD